MPDSSVRPEISIVVANWNGEAFLTEGLASLLRSAGVAERAFELIVVDDCSEDGSAELIRERFPEVRLIENSRNLGFGRTCNLGAREARGRVLVMVNNDVIVPEGFVARLTELFFEGPGGADATPLFAVGAKTVDWERGEPNQLCMNPAWERGRIGTRYSDPSERTPSAFIQAGAAAYDRELFLSLGGFDDLFAPGYWEDYDLSYRAAKAGWRLLYDPVAEARHRGRGSLPRLLGERRLARIVERNRLFFNWLNLSDRRLLCRHVLLLPFVYARDMLTRKGPAGSLGFARALWGLPRCLRSRAARRRSDPAPVRSDRELLGL